MHERGLFRDLVRKIDSVARAEGATRVTRITVRLGPDLRLTQQHFEEHFEAETSGTASAGAAVRFAPWQAGDGRSDSILLESIEVALRE
jgi:Zn finger protein HypA/HybF involved in hydrogenase expression